MAQASDRNAGSSSEELSLSVDMKPLGYESVKYIGKGQSSVSSTRRCAESCSTCPPSVSLAHSHHVHPVLKLVKGNYTCHLCPAAWPKQFPAENNFDPAVDYYRVLGVDERASAADIKHSYKNLARKYHPDVSSEPDATSHFAEINEAYEVLGNERTRSDYDTARAFGKPQYAQFGDLYREGGGGGGRPTRYTYVYRYQNPGEYYEFVDPGDLYDFYASNERARRSGNYYRNTDYDHAGNHNALKFYDVVKSKLLDILTPVCILFIELLVVHTILRAVLVH